MGVSVVVVVLTFIVFFALRRRALARLLRIERPRFTFTSTRTLVPGAEGSALDTRVYRPKGHGPFPVVVIRTPYGLGLEGGPPGIVNHVIASLFCERGVIVVEQSCRGRFSSTGDFVPFVYEHDDGALLLDWITAQPFCDGRIALYGQSYAGFTTWAIADDVRVRALLPVQTSAEFRSIIHADGAFSLETSLRFVHVMEVFGRHTSPALWRSTRAVVRQTAAVRPACETLPVIDSDRALVGREDVHFRRGLTTTDEEDPFWRAIDHRPRRDATRAPALLVAGFFDPFVRETVRDFKALRARERRARLLIGPWTHGQLDGRYLDEVFRLVRACDASGLAEDPVRIVLKDGRELCTDAWPPLSTPRILAIGADGNITEPHASSSGRRTWTHRPDVPVPSIAGAILDLENAGVADNRVLEGREDVLLFTSAPLEKDLLVIGEPTISVRLSSSRPSADLFVRILDVPENGRSENVTDAFVRVDDDALVSNEGVPLSLTFWPMGHTFARGHRVRVLVAGSAHPRWARNLGTRGAQITTTERHVAEHTLILDGAALTLPEVDARALQK